MMLPEGWRKTKVAEIFDVRLGKMLNKAAKVGADQRPYLTNINVRWGHFEIANLNHMNFNKAERDKFRLKHGDLIVCEGGEVGRSAIWKNEIEECYYQKALHRLRPINGAVTPDYMYSYMEFANIVGLLSDYTTRTSIAHLTREKLLTLPVNLPPLSEQRRIAEILSTWDRAIETVEALIANARAQKKALMQSLLTGKKRLPGFNGEWRSVCLGEIGKLRKGKGIQRDQVRATGLPCIRYGEIYTQHHEQVRHFNSFIDAETAADSVPISAGDILFTCSGETAEEIGKCIAYLGSERAYAGGDIIILSPATDNAAFLSYVLNDTEVTEQKRRFGQGNSVVHISAANLARLTFTLPDRAEQDAVANILDDATGHIGGLEIELATLAQEKSALMQQLLTGKRRVQIEAAANV